MIFRLISLTLKKKIKHKSKSKEFFINFLNKVDILLQ